MAKVLGTIKVDGKAREFVNRYSCGPGEVAHTYLLTDGEIVQRIGDAWRLSRVRGGVEPRRVSVEVPPRG